MKAAVFATLAVAAQAQIPLMPRVSHGAPAIVQPSGRRGTVHPQGLPLTHAPATPSYEEYREAAFALDQSDYDIGFSDRYTSATDMDLWNQFGLDTGNLNAFQYADAYGYDLERIERAIDHAHRSPEPISREDMHDLYLQRESARAQVSGLELGALGVGGFLPDYQNFNYRKIDARRARLAFRKAKSQFAKGEITREELDNAYDVMRVEQLEREGAGFGFMGAGTIGPLRFLEAADIDVDLAEDALYDAMDAHAKAPSSETAREVELAELSLLSVEQTRLARLGDLIGSPLITAIAWQRGGEYDDEYFRIVDDHLRDTYEQKYGRSSYGYGSRRRGFYGPYY